MLKNVLQNPKMIHFSPIGERQQLEEVFLIILHSFDSYLQLFFYILQRCYYVNKATE